MPTPSEILDAAYRRANVSLNQPLVNDVEIASKIAYVCRNVQNRAGVRLILSASLAKIHRPEVDIRKPYTEIGDDDAYSGRTYDEAYIAEFINRYNLPCNRTTAFLTPALRTGIQTLTPDLNLAGRPRRLYQTTLELLNDVYSNRLSAEDLLAETVRLLLVIREESRQRIEALLAGLRASEETVPLSSEMIVNLIQQHLSTPGASRLPVLVVAAAYRAAGEHLRERVLPLESHTSADEQTGALGDVQITLLDDNDVVTSYEMKNRRVTHEDIEIALRKIANSGLAIDNYIFITKEPIDQDVQDYAREVYARTGGIEVVVLDCMGFIRHFLHLFHRLRTQYLEAYQQLVLEEPLSAVNQHLKEVFLNLRQAAEAMLSES